MMLLGTFSLLQMAKYWLNDYYFLFWPILAVSIKVKFRFYPEQVINTYLPQHQNGYFQIQLKNIPSWVSYIYYENKWAKYLPK